MCIEFSFLWYNKIAAHQYSKSSVSFVHWNYHINGRDKQFQYSNTRVTQTNTMTHCDQGIRVTRGTPLETWPQHLRHTSTLNTFIILLSVHFLLGLLIKINDHNFRQQTVPLWVLGTWEVSWPLLTTIRARN